MTPTNTRGRSQWAVSAVLAVLAAVLPAVAQPVKLAGDKAVPPAPFRTEAMHQRAAPTSQ